MLADRGSTVQDSVGLYCAEVKAPPFVSYISSVRIYIERVTRSLSQNYTTLESINTTINMIMCDDKSNISIIDNIVVVCSALCNVCHSIISFCSLILRHSMWNH